MKPQEAWEDYLFKKRADLRAEVQETGEPPSCEPKPIANYGDFISGWVYGQKHEKERIGEKVKKAVTE